MKRISFLVTFLILVSIGFVLSQEHAPLSPTGPNPTDAAGSAIGSVAPLFETVKAYTIASAEQMPEEDYGYRPTPEVRTFGQIIGHVAMAQYWFCNGATGGGPEPDDYEAETSKAALVDAITKAFDHCSDAYGMNDDWALEEVELWGQTNTRLWVLSFNMAHTWEHYGNLVTYMRENGLVPPSSQGGM